MADNENNAIVWNDDALRQSLEKATQQANQTLIRSGLAWER